MPGNQKLILYPFSLIYGFIAICRNYLYDIKVLKSVSFKVPVISVGNITVGGTGKTPHTEYLIRLLKTNHKIAYLSRGYKRKTKGFLMADGQLTANELGDEPFQVSRKFPEVSVVVDNNRVKGITTLLSTRAHIDIILLDDAFQHRKVTPGLNILLVDYSKPIYKDYLLPYGFLREPVNGKKRADIVIVTKVPESISEQEKEEIKRRLKIKSGQEIFFTSIIYGKPIPVFRDAMNGVSVDFENSDLEVLLVTGIANPEPVISMLTVRYKSVVPLIYPDHYSYNQKDINNIIRRYKNMGGDNKVIITTEKDSARLLPFNLIANIPQAWYCIPIETKFNFEEGDKFNNHIFNYVRKN